jgi:hypothetical protein
MFDPFAHRRSPLDPPREAPDPPTPPTRSPAELDTAAGIDPIELAVGSMRREAELTGLLLRAQRLLADQAELIRRLAPGGDLHPATPPRWPVQEAAGDDEEL